MTDPVYTLYEAQAIGRVAEPGRPRFLEERRGDDRIVNTIDHEGRIRVSQWFGWYSPAQVVARKRASELADAYVKANSPFMSLKLQAQKKLIDRLARQAGFPVEDFGEGDVRVYGLGQEADTIDAPLTRFAALIADECAKVCENLNAFDEDDPGGTAAAAIREKFRSAP